MIKTNFFSKLLSIYTTDQSRSVILYGNVYDLFDKGIEPVSDFVPLIPFLCEKGKQLNLIQVVYETNGPIRIQPEHREKLKQAWIESRLGQDPNNSFLSQLKRSIKTGEKPDTEIVGDKFEDHLIKSMDDPTLALECLRQLTICSRKFLKDNDLLIIIEAADLLLPAGNGDVASLNEKQLHRIRVLSDWLGDPEFNNGKDMLVMVAESRSLIHPRIAKLPQVVSVEVPSPDFETRKKFIAKYSVIKDDQDKDSVNYEQGARLTAGLSLYALLQLIKTASSQNVFHADVIDKVEEFIQSQLGEDVIEFKKPMHKLDDCIGFKTLKKFLKETLIPRMQLKGVGMISGACVAGPIGSGKTYIFEAMAAELNMPVLVLKNIRSQWFGQTDVIFERLRRVLEALESVLIFVDEADTQFGGVGSDVHETERRLTGKIQAMMSDTKLKGKVYWLLMTARINNLSPDIRRPGRVGDLIIPVLDPEGMDRKDFIEWAIKGIEITGDTAFSQWTLIDDIEKKLPKDYSSASFTSLKNNLAFKKTFSSRKDLFDEIEDFIQPAIGETRRFQTLQALVNCTRKSLLPNPYVAETDRNQWTKEIRELELFVGLK